MENNIKLSGTEIVKRYIQSIVLKAQYWIPLLTLTILAYIPSFTNTKVQFEDFHWDLYYGSGKAMLAGRWWLYLWGHVLNNDILNKYLGFIFLLLAAIITGAIFYYLSNERSRVLPYTVLSLMVSTYPLINEIWSYNGNNFIVASNLAIISACVLYALLSSAKDIVKTIVLSLALMLVASSYESCVFAYVTLVMVVLFYQLIRGRKTLLECMKSGLRFAAPLITGVILGTAIGYLICAIEGLPYFRYGDTGLHWGAGALQALLLGNFEHYVVRGLVYLPIFVFDVALAIFGCFCLSAVFRKRAVVLLAGVVVVASIFLQSLIQGSWLPYRTAQTLTYFSAFSFFLFMEYVTDQKVLKRSILTAMVLVACFSQSVFLSKVNTIDYRNAHNDESLVRQIGYELTTEYYGKPVLFVGHHYDTVNLYSDYIFQQMSVDANSLNGEAYYKLRRILNIEGIMLLSPKYFDTNLWSTLFLLSVEPSAMEQYFSYCGYSIKVLDNNNLQADYPDVQTMYENGELHTLQFVDMGDYVVVGLQDN